MQWRAAPGPVACRRLVPVCSQDHPPHFHVWRIAATGRCADVERDQTTRRQSLFQTITNLSNCAERAQRRIQAIMHALKTRDKETRAIEARVRQTMIDLTGDAAAADPAPEDQTPPTTRS